MNPQLQQQIRQVDQLCECVYTSQNSQERASAEAHLASLFNTSSLNAQLGPGGVAEKSLEVYEVVLQNSTNPYTLFFVASSLINLFTNNWNAVSAPQKLQIRNLLVNFIATNGPGLPNFVMAELIKLLCRITKFGWFLDQAHRDLPEQIKNFFLQPTSSVPHQVLGLQILKQLIEEINDVQEKRTLTQHRKTAVSFRDNSLLSIFQAALNNLSAIRDALPNMNKRLLELALQVCLQSLRFDFVGIFPDESSDDAGAIQIPTTWKAIFEDANTLKLFWVLYAAAPSELLCSILENVVMFASVRRSLFSNDKKRTEFLEDLMNGTLEIMKTNKGLNEQKNYHEFCRLLSRLKFNFQINEIVNADNYSQWIQYAANFTIESFKSWQWSSPSVQYLLSLWSRLITSQPYLKSAKSANLSNFVPEMLKTYLSSRMEIAAAVVQNDYDDPLEDHERLLEQLEPLAPLVHSGYEQIANFMCTIFDPLLATYNDYLVQGNAQNPNMPILHRQMSWLIYIFGCVVGQRPSSSTGGGLSSASTTSNSNTNTTEINDTCDAELTCRVLRALTLMDKHLQLLQHQTRFDRSLELFENSLLYFLQQFRKVYIGELAMTSSKVYARLSQLLDLGDHIAVLNVIVNKLLNNLKVWSKSEVVIQKTLDMLTDLANGYTSSKLLMKLNSVRFLLSNPSNDQFPFLKEASNARHRTAFYSILCKLLFMENLTEEIFLKFLYPIQMICTQLQQIGSIEQFRQPAVKNALVGLFRDLRGVASACLNRKSYNYLFDWIFPQHTPLLIKTAEVFFDTPDVINSLLKFMCEFVLNRSQRILFDSSSPNGILLFKETSKLLVAYGTRILTFQPKSDPYQERYKGVWMTAQILARSLGGSYCNFGVFTLYGDRAFSDALDIVVKLLVSVPMQDLMAYKKVSKAYFALLDIIFHNHAAAVSSLETPYFLHLVASLEEGIKSNDTTIVSQTCSALDHLCTYYYEQSKKDSAISRNIRNHLSQRPELLPQILGLFFNIILFDDCTNQWSLSRPMLALVVTHEKYFNEIKVQITNSLSGDRQKHMMEAFETLMKDVECNLEPKNRDKFTGNLILFKQEVKTFL